MSDIVERLRQAPRQPDCPHGLRPKACKDCQIEELEAEIERLRAALKDAGESLEWAARRLNDNYASKADVMAVYFAAGQTTKARRTGDQE